MHQILLIIAAFYRVVWFSSFKPKNSVMQKSGKCTSCSEANQGEHAIKC